MTRNSSMMRKLMVLMMAFAIMLTYSVVPVNQSFAASAKKPTKIILNAKSKTLTVGKTFKAKVKTVKPKKASKTVTWKSSNKKVAAVNSKGVITAKKAGKATITAVSKKNKKVKAKIKLTVKEKRAVKEVPATLGEKKSRTMHVYIDMSQYDKGSVVRTWIPVPKSDEYQTIDNVGYTVMGNPEDSRFTVEKENGNNMLYIKWDANEDPANRKAELSFDASRVAVSRSDLKDDAKYVNSEEAEKYLTEESEYVKVNDPVVQDLAAKIVGDEKGTVEKAKLIYDWIIANFQRINNGETVNGHKFEVQGCGYGDVVNLIKAYNECGTSGGHCTDINSTYVALCRAAGVPAREMFGIRLNDDASGGQHCWTEFYLPGTGWVYADPADVLKEARSYTDKGMGIAEARQQASVLKKAQELWGGVDNNRIVLATGRDITFEPAQSWGKCNTFGYPAAEVNEQRLPDFTNPKAFNYTITCTEIGKKDYVHMLPNDWKTYGIDSDEIRNTDCLVDVRGDKASGGFVPGAAECAVSNPYTDEQKAAIKAEYDKAVAADKRMVLVCVSGNMLARNAMAALQASGADMSKVTYLIGGFGTWSKNFATVSEDKKSLSVPAWVTQGDGPDGKLLMLKTNDQLDPDKADLTHHVLVNERGSNAKAALLNTKTLPMHVYDGLKAIGGTPSDKFNKADAFNADGSAKTGAKLDSAAQKVNVSFAAGDKTYTMADFFDQVTTPTSEIVKAADVKTEPYVADMRFGGCWENIKDKFLSPSGNQTGCITCTFSCWIGTVSNYQYGYNTEEAKVNRANVPAANTPVTVVYTLG